MKSSKEQTNHTNPWVMSNITISLETDHEQHQLLRKCLNIALYLGFSKTYSNQVTYIQLKLTFRLDYIGWIVT